MRCSSARNPGWSSDRPLRYAENDAERVRDVLVSLGGFAPDRVILLRDPDTNEVRASLRDLTRTAKSEHRRHARLLLLLGSRR